MVFFRHQSAFRGRLGFAAFDSNFRREESGGIFIFRKILSIVNSNIYTLKNIPFHWNIASVFLEK